jgi:glycosyltransferase involved in cell wall biosynthesis
LACGTPCVGFNIGGIPEMIDHKKNGYVAEYKDAEDLSKGILWTLFESDSNVLSSNARKKAIAEYEEGKIAKQYLDIYEQ